MGCRKRRGGGGGEEVAGLKDRATEDPAKRHPRRNSNIGVASDSCSLSRYCARSPFPPWFPPLGRLLCVYTHLGTHLRGLTAAKVKLRRLLPASPLSGYIIQLPVRLTSQTNEQIAVGFYDYQPFHYFPSFPSQPLCGRRFFFPPPPRFSITRALLASLARCKGFVRNELFDLS